MADGVSSAASSKPGSAQSDSSSGSNSSSTAGEPSANSTEDALSNSATTADKLSNSSTTAEQLSGQASISTSSAANDEAFAETSFHDSNESASPSQSDESNSSTESTAASVAAAGAREAARTAVDPVHRSFSGWALADDAKFSATSQMDTTAAADAKSALTRTDLPPAVQNRVRTVVERLGNSLTDGDLARNVNTAYRADLNKLATLPASDSAFTGALAQMGRAAEVLDRETLAAGTRLAYDPAAGQSGVNKAGLPTLEIADLDADLYFKTSDGTLHVESVKAAPGGLSSALDSYDVNAIDQLSRQVQWEKAGTASVPRSLTVAVADDGPRFYSVVGRENPERLMSIKGDNPNTRQFVFGDQALSLNDLKQFDTNASAAGKTHVENLAKAHVEAGNPIESFKASSAYNDYYKKTANTAHDAVRNFIPNAGKSAEPLTRLPSLPPADITGGAVFGAVAASAVTLIDVAQDGLTPSDAGPVLKSTAIGALAGAATAAGERVVTPIVDRTIGSSVQRASSAAAPRIASTLGTASSRAAGLATAEGSAAFNAGARTMASRISGASVVGTAVATGVSIWENREGLAAGESQAVGNVVADTAVAGGSILAATLSGAAVGTAIPVPIVGTAVGAAVGLGLGVAAAYGAQVSGARDFVADKVSSAVDYLKSWF